MTNHYSFVCHLVSQAESCIAGRIFPCKILREVLLIWYWKLSKMATDLEKPSLLGKLSRQEKALSPVVIIGIARLLDAVLVAISSLLVFYLYVYPVSLSEQTGYLLLSVACAPLAVFIFQSLHLYNVHTLNRIPAQLPRLAGGWSFMFVLLLAAAFFTKSGDAFSRVWFLLWYTGGFAGLLTVRFILGGLIRNWMQQGRLSRNAIIVGGGKAGEEVIKAIQECQDSDIKVIGIFDDRSESRQDKSIPGFPILGNVEELVNLGRDRRIDLLIVTLPLTAESRLQEIFKKLWVLPVDIRLSAHTHKLNFRPRSYSYIGNTPMIDVYDKPLADWDYVLKSLFDKVVASVALVLLSPVMLATAIAVRWESKGPVFFKQKRYGFNNELIEVYKFRSMYTDMSDANAARLVTKDDPRVTRVGKFIRKTSLDELPQLFNVLKGELSLVGPRPHAVQAKAGDKLYDEAVDGYFARHKVKPGITGWAQINGWRGETDTPEKIEQRVAHDLYYIENWSLFFDIIILLRTPLSLLNTKNAY